MSKHSWDCDSDRGGACTCLPMNSPKHLVRHDNSMSHCCFAGCTPRGCEGRCCVQEFGHRADCPQNPWREYDEQDHAIYVKNGGPKHYAEPCTGGNRCKAKIHIHGCYAENPAWVYP